MTTLTGTNDFVLTPSDLMEVLGGDCSWGGAGKAVVSGAVSGATSGFFTGGVHGAVAGAGIGAVGNGAGYLATCWW